MTDSLLEKSSVGIIIPFYNGYTYLDKLLKSIELASYNFNCTVFIIDNSIENKEIIAPCLNLKVEIIKEKSGIGYGKACNKGFELCKQKDFDYIIIANQDGYFSPQLIDALIKPFKEDKKIQITAPLLYTYEGNSFEHFFVKYYLVQIPQMISDLLKNEVKPFYEMEKISGACFAFNLRNESYTFNYLFDPLFHMYYEDEDLCRRIKLIQSKIYLISEQAIFYHQHSHTTDKENADEISSNKIYSEIILRVKDPAKSTVRTLYGIFTTTATATFYHLLRGEIKKCISQIKPIGMIFYHMGAIMKSRKRDMLITLKKFKHF